MNQLHLKQRPNFRWLLACCVVFLLIVAGADELRAAPITPAVTQADGAAANDWPVLQAGQAPAPLESTNCRYGVGYLADIRPSLPWVSKVGAGWLVNWGPFPELDQPSTETVYTIRIKQLTDENGKRLPKYTVYLPLTDKDLGYFVRRFPDSVWLVGNEIDVDHPLQDGITPELYARAYHEVYTFIKSIDPSARVGNGSVAMVTPGRLQYLDRVWDTYRSLYRTNMPVDVWNVHLYNLSERTRATKPTHADGHIAIGTDPTLAFRSSGGRSSLCPDPTKPDAAANDPASDTICVAEYDSVRLLRDQVLRMRTWMKAKGQQNKPLIVTEFGVLPYYDVAADGTCSPTDEFGRCFTPERVTAHLEGAINFMEDKRDTSLGYQEDDYRLVQRWAWFSLYTTYPTGDSSNLLTDDYSSLPTGSQSALSPIGAAFRRLAQSDQDQGLSWNLVADATQVETCTESVELSATYRNVGSMSIVEPYNVTFYSDSDLSNAIGTVRVDPKRTGPVMGCGWGGQGERVTLPSSIAAADNFSYWYRIDADGAIDESQESDNVGQGVVRVKGQTLIAGFAANMATGKPPRTVQFIDQSDGCATTWSWNFGDGATSTERNPTHSYRRFGTYSVSLTITNGNLSHTTTTRIRVRSRGLDQARPGEIQSQFPDIDLR